MSSTRMTVAGSAVPHGCGADVCRSGSFQRNLPCTASLCRKSAVPLSRTANALRRFRRRSSGPSSFCGAVFRVRTSIVSFTGSPLRRPRRTASSPAWLKPRLRSRAGCTGTGTRTASLCLAKKYPYRRTMASA